MPESTEPTLLFFRAKPANALLRDRGDPCSGIVIPFPGRSRSHPKARRLAGRRALVTGGASGIGRAVALAFAREGADVAFTHLPHEVDAAKAVAAEIHTAGGRALRLATEMRDQDSCVALVTAALRGFAGLDVLVNTPVRQPYAMFWMTRSALAHMAPGAVIINTASINRQHPSCEVIDPAATRLFTEGLARQLTSQGIRVNAITQGPAIAHPEDLAPVYVLLASDESAAATGQMFGTALSR